MSGSRSNLPKVRKLREVKVGDGGVEVVKLDPTLRGYHVTWNYGIRYWLPLLGPIPWLVWQTLLSFCYGDRDTCWPSVELLADTAAKGNRQLITGRWRGKGEKRRRQPGALEILEQAGLLTVERLHSGRKSGYRFRVLREPPILTPEQLAQLSPRIQETHAELLIRCGLDDEGYRQRSHWLRRPAAVDTTSCAQGTSPCAQDTTPYARDTTNKYKEELQIEEVWRTIKKELESEVSSGNYRAYVEATRPLTFDEHTGTLLVEAASPLAASRLNSDFQMTIRRAVANTGISLEGIPLYAVEFVADAHRA